MNDLDEYLREKREQVRRVESLLRTASLNHRQMALLSHAIRHPSAEYSIKSHQTSHNVGYATARELARREMLIQHRLDKKTYAFIAPDDLEARIQNR